jgi:hypothetical protein
MELTIRREASGLDLADGLARQGEALADLFQLSCVSVAPEAAASLDG